MKDYCVGYFIDVIPVLLGPLAWTLGYGAMMAEAEWECSDPWEFAR